MAKKKQKTKRSITITKNESSNTPPKLLKGGNGRNGRNGGNGTKNNGTRKNPPKKKGAPLSSSTSKKTVTKDWISALAAKSSVTNQENDTSQQPVLSKEERIQRRNAKKRRREERKGNDDDDSRKKQTLESPITNEDNYDNNKSTNLQSLDQMIFYRSKLSDTIHCILKDIRENESSKPEWKRKQLYTPLEKKGKATTGQQLIESKIQPRSRDYGGLGLARPSLLLNLRDPSFVPKFELEFGEHVEGFFGKQRTKAMKKQLDGNLLWRQMQRLKEGAQSESGGGKGKKGKNLNVKYRGKKLLDMTPDERVEAMIQLNML